jgi:catechol 2,3-dioxygenase-like lactoylglutathione lyase family enzyme
MDLGCFEVGLNVGDVARSLAFYKALGFSVIDGGPDAPAATICKDDCRITLRRGAGHDPVFLAFRQGDMAAIAAELERRGVSFQTAPGGVVRGLRLEDPDGAVIVLAPGAPRRGEAAADGVALGHFEISLDVQDMDRTADFYRALGFAVVESAQRNVTLTSGDCRLSLYQGHLDPARTQLIFWQGDIDAIAGEVRRQGLDFFQAPRGDDKGAVFMLRDPDDNPLFFINLSVKRGTAG